MGNIGLIQLKFIKMLKTGGFKIKNFRKKLLFTAMLFAAVTSPVIKSTGADKTVIRHRGFEDFSKGTFGDGGVNIYVSQSGVIQLIHRWDINDDGYMDLLISQDHNDVETVDA